MNSNTATPLIPENVSLPELRRAAAGCKACDLWKNATQTVFGEGKEGARIMLVGEQPGDQEDLAGKPFVGPVGRLLDEALLEAGIDRSEVYVTNIVKHSHGNWARGGSDESTRDRVPHKSPRAARGSMLRSPAFVHRFWSAWAPPQLKLFWGGVSALPKATENLFCPP